MDLQVFMSHLYRELESMDALISMEFGCLEIKLSCMHHLDAEKQMEIENLESDKLDQSTCSTGEKRGRVEV